MPTYEWSQKKNDWLKKHRNIDFKRIVEAIEKGKIIDIIAHPNRKKYKNQFAYIVNIKSYAYFVPFVKTKKRQQTVMFLKTVYKSKKLTQKYIKKKVSK